MLSSAQGKGAHPAALVRSLEELVQLVGSEPTGALVGGDDVRAVRAARWMLGGVAESGGDLSVDRTRALAEKLRRLADAVQRA